MLTGAVQTISDRLAYKHCAQIEPPLFFSFGVAFCSNFCVIQHDHSAVHLYVTLQVQRSRSVQAEIEICTASPVALKQTTKIMSSSIPRRFSGVIYRNVPSQYEFASNRVRRHDFGVSLPPLQPDDLNDSVLKELSTAEIDRTDMQAICNSLVGKPLLVNHNTSDQVGVVTAAYMTDTMKGTKDAVVEFELADSEASQRIIQGWNDSKGLNTRPLIGISLCHDPVTMSGLEVSLVDTARRLDCVVMASSGDTPFFVTMPTVAAAAAAFGTAKQPPGATTDAAAASRPAPVVAEPISVAAASAAPQANAEPAEPRMNATPSGTRPSSTASTHSIKMDILQQQQQQQSSAASPAQSVTDSQTSSASSGSSQALQMQQISSEQLSALMRTVDELRRKTEQLEQAKAQPQAASVAAAAPAPAAAHKNRKRERSSASNDREEEETLARDDKGRFTNNAMTDESSASDPWPSAATSSSSAAEPGKRAQQADVPVTGYTDVDSSLRAIANAQIDEAERSRLMDMLRKKARDADRQRVEAIEAWKSLYADEPGADGLIDSLSAEMNNVSTEVINTRHQQALFNLRAAQRRAGAQMSEQAPNRQNPAAAAPTFNRPSNKDMPLTVSAGNNSGSGGSSSSSSSSSSSRSSDSGWQFNQDGSVSAMSSHIPPTMRPLVEATGGDLGKLTDNALLQRAIKAGDPHNSAVAARGFQSILTALVERAKNVRSGAPVMRTSRVVSASASSNQPTVWSHTG